MSRSNLAVLVAAAGTLFSPVSGQKHDSCDRSTFYSSITNLNDGAQLTALLQTMHRDALPYTSTGPDVWDALIALDADPDDPSQVKLIYRDAYMPAEPHGTTGTWNREHLWPKSHGVDYTGADFTDLHALRPADWSVNAARGNKFFSRCGIADISDDCITPAHPEAASDTQKDTVSWLPPANVRGDIARSLMYMSIRYDGSESGTLDLWLTDCPDDNDPAELGYLSQLLQWHADDPVDAAEMERNDKVCSDWQGNRNPFVDYPELVHDFFGYRRADPASDGGGYDCSIPNPSEPPPPTTPPPTPATIASPPTGPTQTTAGTCLGLLPGDVMLTGFTSDNPDNVVLAALADIPEGATLYLTDNAWTGSAFKSNEGTLKVTIPTGGLAAGSIFSYESASTVATEVNALGSAWTAESGSFRLSSSADSIFVYCLDDDASGNPTVPVHLTAMTYNSVGWSPAGSTYTSGQSALPDNMPSTAVLTLPHVDNYVYAGIRTGTLTELRGALSDASNWSGSNSFIDVLSNQAPLAIESSSCGFGVENAQCSSDADCASCTCKGDGLCA